MLAIRIRKIIQARKGQTMVLGALGVLVVAIMVMLTLNIGQAIHEKIRIQQAADAIVYSKAIREARTFNYLAYSNRANISSLAGAASIHSFMSMAKAEPTMFSAAGIQYILMGAAEFGVCATCCNPKCTANCIHCVHGVRDFMSASKYFLSSTTLQNAVSNLENNFEDTIEALDKHMETIRDSQVDMYNAVYKNDSLAHRLINKFASRSQSDSGVASLTRDNFEKAVIIGDEDETRGNSIRQWSPSEIANHTLKNFAESRLNLMGKRFIHDDTWKDFEKEDASPSKGNANVLFSFGQSAIVAGGQCSVAKDGPKGDSACSSDSGIVFASAINMCSISGGTIPMPLFGQATHELKCLGSGECFTVFNSSTDPGEDFGQPHVYGIVSQDLSVSSDLAKAPPWELKTKGHVHFDMGGNIQNKHDYAKDIYITDKPGFSSQHTKGFAMSKALAYYHLPGDWKEHPNFFCPHWRAKLQPLRSSEALRVLNNASEYTVRDYRGLIQGGGPLP